MADFPIELDAALAGRLARALDVEGKIPRALETLGPVDGRDVYLVDGQAGGIRATQLEALGARVVAGGPIDRRRPTASPTRRSTSWSAAGPRSAASIAAEMAEAARVLRPGGRLLAVHDYGRDDVSRLHGDATGVRGLEPSRRPVPARRVQDPGDPLLLDVRVASRTARASSAAAFGEPGQASGPR